MQNRMFAAPVRRSRALSRSMIMVVLAALMTSVLSGSPASADPFRWDFPIRCGMTVDVQANLHLDTDLYCAEPIAITIEPQAWDSGVDLQGHRLYGSGSNVGIVGGYEFRNGRIEHFGVGLVASWSVVYDNIELVNNDVGLRCDGWCSVYDLYLKNNRTAVQVLPASGVSVRTSSFVHNRSGISINDVSSTVDVENSTFARNAAGIKASRGTVRAGNSLFRHNRVGIELVPTDQTDCADVALTLESITYFKNVKNVRGRLC